MNNIFRVLEDVHMSKERVCKDEKAFRYEIKCKINGEDKKLYGIDRPIERKNIASIPLKRVNAFKKRYCGVKCLYKDKCVEIVDFLYENNCNISLVYRELGSEVIRYDPLGKVLMKDLKLLLRQRAMTKEYLCDLELNNRDFMLLGKRFNKTKDIIDEYKLSKYTVMNFIQKRDFAGLELYAAYKNHMHKRSKK